MSIQAMQGIALLLVIVSYIVWSGAAAADHRGKFTDAIEFSSFLVLIVSCAALTALAWGCK